MSKQTLSGALRASKFASSLAPPAPTANQADPVVDEKQSETEPAPVNVAPALREESTPEPAPPRKERSKRSGGIDLDEILNAPKSDVRFNNQIQISDAHHQLLRELNFNFKKPMTTILHNLLEQLNAAYQQHKNKQDA